MQAIVIDDSRATRLILGQLLRSLGFDVAEAADGRQGLEELRRRGDVDLALVDGNMPDMDGLALVRAVRADPGFRSLRLLLVSAEQDAGQVRRTLEAGADGYLAKPFSRQTVLDELCRLGLRSAEV